LSKALKKARQVYYKNRAPELYRKTHTLRVCKIKYRNQKGCIYNFITNSFEISNKEVTVLYKKWWKVELMFKKLKQIFPLRYFYSDTENGIKMQVWITLIAYLLFIISKAPEQTSKSFSTIATMIRLHFIGHLDFFWIIANKKKV